MFSHVNYNNHQTTEFRYESVKEYVSANIDKINSIIDIGSGKGTMLQILSDNFSNIKLISCDLNKYHDLNVEFQQLDLSDKSKYVYFPVNDLLICLDVLEHLEKTFIEDVLKYFSMISKNSILTVSNHSDIIDGIELHTIQEDDTYWTPLISKYFTVNRVNEYYHVFGKPRLYIYYLTSNNINT